MKLLIVDDEQSVRNSLGEFFSDYGYETHCVESAEEALVYLKDEQPDLMIVDMRLPLMDGNNLILEVNRIYPKMLYIIYTGSVSYKIPEEIRNAGISEEHVIHKPIKDMHLFIELINRLHP